MLPAGPLWSFKTVPTFAPTKDPVVLYYKDPIICLQAIFSNPLFQDHIELTPYHIYKSMDKCVREYKEWMSGDVA